MALLGLIILAICAWSFSLTLQCVWFNMNPWAVMLVSIWHVVMASVALRMILGG